MRIPVILLSFVAGFALGDSPIRVIRTAETREPPSLPLDLLRRETVDLRVRVLNYGEPIDLAGYTIALHGQTNGQLESSAYVLPGAPGIGGDASAAADGWASVQIDVDAWWPADADSGAWTLLATNAANRILRAGGPLTVRGTAAADAVAPLPESLTAAIMSAIEAASTNYVSAVAAATAELQAAIDAEIAARLSMFSGDWRNDVYWYLDARDVCRDISGISTSTVLDRVVELVSSNTTAIDRQMRVEWVRGWPDSNDVSWSVAPPHLATISASGYLSMLAPGLVSVTATFTDLPSKTLPISLYAPAIGDYYERLIGGTTGSLRAAAAANIDDRASNTNDSYWAVIDHATSNYTRDPTCWAADADLSGVAVSTGGTIPAWHGTLVTSQHVAMAKHVYNSVGATKRFVGRSGEVYVRTIAALRDPAPGLPWGPSGGDTMIAKLSAALPTNDVAVYPVLAVDTSGPLPTGLSGIPVLVYNQHQQAKIADLFSAQSITIPTDTQRLAHWYLPYKGDSGRPVFLWTDQGLVCLWTFTYACSNSKPLQAMVDAINAVIAQDGAALTIANLSAYTDFSGE